MDAAGRLAPLDIFTELAIFTDIVKNTHTVKIEGPFEPWVIEAVGAVPGFVAHHGPRTTIEIDGRTRTVEITLTRMVDAARARFLADRAQQRRRRSLIVIAETLTEAARRTLETSGVGYVDGQGNAHVRLPGVYVHTTGSATSKVDIHRSPSRLSGKAGLVVQAMLIEPGRSWQIAGLVTHCGVSAGLVHRVLARLETAELVTGVGVGPAKRRQVARPSALLDLWAEEDAEAGMRRHAIFVLPAPTLSIAAICSAGLEAAGILHAVTGAAAGATLAPALTAVPIVEIRIGRTVSVDEVLVALEARPVEQGANVVLLQPSSDNELRFRQRPHHAWLTANTRIYLDALRDPRRGREQAQAFREAVMGI